LTAGHGGCLNLKPTANKTIIKRSNIRNGAVVVKDPQYVSEFEADIRVLHHSTTITKNYQPTIHCNGMTQCARILEMDKEFLRNGDTSRVRFQFLYRPAFLEVGNILIFREGNTKGIGKIVSI
jgi:GTPase